MKVPAKLLNGTEGTGPHVAPSHDTEEKGHTLGIIHSQLVLYIVSNILEVQYMGNLDFSPACYKLTNST
jgi:hypothetical protein